MKIVSAKKKGAREASKTSTEKAPKRSSEPPAPAAKSPSATSEKSPTRPIDQDLTHKALTALLRHHTDGVDPKTSLLGTDVAVQVQFGLEVAPGKAKTKPIPLVLPNPIYKLYSDDPEEDSALEEPEVCLIVKEESKAEIQEMVTRFPQYMGCIKKVMGLQSLRTKHGEFKQRRDLLARFTCFLADDRILPMLTSALGKDFIAAKKQPIPVRIGRKESLPFAIQKALAATYLHIPEGTCVTVRVGFTHMALEKLVENVVQVCDQVGATIPRKWANIRSIAIKLPTSTALPIYNKTPAELQEISKMAGLPSAWKSAEECAAEQKARIVEERTAKEADSNKRKTEKSPLLRALKKQKKAAVEESDIPVAVEEGDIPVATKNVEVEETSAAESSGKKRKESSNDKEPKATQKSAKKIQKIEVQTHETKTSTTPSKTKNASKSKQTIEVVSPESTKATGTTPSAKMKDDATKSQRPVREKAETKKESKTFVPAKKFEGSKKGFVFKNGKNGLGYYVDVKPEVNKAAMEAIARMQSRPKQQKQPQRGSVKRNKSPKSGGKQRRRQNHGY